MDMHQGENSETGKRKRKENHKQGKKNPKLEKEIKIQKLELEKKKSEIGKINSSN